MSERDSAQQVRETLAQAQARPAAEALPILNGLIPLVQGGGADGLEVEEARASTFLAICEVGKALHRGQPADGPYAAAITAADRWLALAR